MLNKPSADLLCFRFDFECINREPVDLDDGTETLLLQPLLLARLLVPAAQLPSDDIVDAASSSVDLDFLFIPFRIAVTARFNIMSGYYY